MSRSLSHRPIARTLLAPAVASAIALGCVGLTAHPALAGGAPTAQDTTTAPEAPASTEEPPAPEVPTTDDTTAPDDSVGTTPAEAPPTEDTASPSAGSTAGPTTEPAEPAATDDGEASPEEHSLTFDRASISVAELEAGEAITATASGFPPGTPDSGFRVRISQIDGDMNPIGEDVFLDVPFDENGSFTLPIDADLLDGAGDASLALSPGSLSLGEIAANSEADGTTGFLAAISGLAPSTTYDFLVLHSEDPMAGGTQWTFDTDENGVASFTIPELSRPDDASILGEWTAAVNGSAPDDRDWIVDTTFTVTEEAAAGGARRSS